MGIKRDCTLQGEKNTNSVALEKIAKKNEIFFSAPPIFNFLLNFSKIKMFRGESRKKKI